MCTTHSLKVWLEKGEIIAEKCKETQHWNKEIKHIIIGLKAIKESQEKYLDSL
jgi:hypothetical protein